MGLREKRSGFWGIRINSSVNLGNKDYQIPIGNRSLGGLKQRFFRACGGLFLQISVYKFKNTRISRLQQSIPQSGIQKSPQRAAARFFEPAPVRTDTAPSDYSEQFSQDCGSEPTHGIQNGISESVTVPGKTAVEISR